ncbi:Vacuolar protein sorting-associated protein 72-like protein [Trichoplax sp. H2]|nr:Vacuolar protein sorting-associated protein 72-like protein [Trichoplax sp. H2]|eukprot:RDD40826.1 Vacuolar protein sorting-associated protein 72-like protein [Trichoplax sp. H2]
MASNRSQRSNAGNRMSRLIDEEAEEDEFYETAFGGFQEESDDEKYDTEESEEDVADSDIDASEHSEQEDASSDDSQPRKKRKKIVIAAVARDKNNTTKVGQKRERKVIASTSTVDTDEGTSRSVRKSKRSATMVQSQEFLKRMKDRDGKEVKQSIKKSQDSRPLTQKELLEEAKETEKANLASLREYQESEKEKRATKVIRRKLLYPFVRYQSITMPDVDLQPNGDQNDNNNTLQSDQSLNESSKNHVEVTADSHDHNYNKKSIKKEEYVVPVTTKKYSRNFITFTDTSKYPSTYFPVATLSTEAKPPICPVTNLPARYIDPATLIPYATLDAFKIIREAAQSCANTIKEETKEIQPVIASLHTGAQ